MKKIFVFFIIVAFLTITPQLMAGDTDNFHRGFHEGLGHNAADAVVGVFARILSGDFNGDGYCGDRSPRPYYRRRHHVPPPRLMPPTGNAARWARSPRDRAYYRAKDRVYWQEYRRWEQEERRIGRAEGELEALYNVRRNRTRFFTGH